MRSPESNLGKEQFRGMSGISLPFKVREGTFKQGDKINPDLDNGKSRYFN